MPINYALASNGATIATQQASDSFDPVNYPVASLINGLRGGSWGTPNGGWASNAAPDSSTPFYIIITFSGEKLIDGATLVTLPDDTAQTAEPGAADTFTLYGATNATVDVWNGTAWVNAASYTNNNLVVKSVSFPAVKTTKVRFGSVPGTGGRTRWRELEVSGLPPLSITTASPLPSVVSGASYNQNVNVTGDAQPIASAIVSAGALPAGLTVAAGQTSGVGAVISGTTSAAAGTYNFTVSITDNAGQTASKALSITVKAPFAKPLVPTETIPVGFEELQNQTLLNVSDIELSMPVITANFGDGYGAAALAGNAAGLRTWTLSSDVIPDLPEYRIDYDIDAEMFTASRFEYLWEFYRRHQALGNKPFFLTDPRTKRKFAASFTDSTLSFAALTAKFYSGTLQLRQRRVRGKYFRPDDGSYFDAESFRPNMDESVAHWYKAEMETGYASSGAGINRWHDLVGSVDLVCAANAPLWQASAVGGRAAIKFDGTRNPLAGAGAGGVFKQIFIVASIDEATFGAFRGLVTGQNVTAVLVGNSGDTRFFNFDFSASSPYRFRRDNISYEEQNQSAAMNGAYAIYSARARSGFNLDGIQIGRDRADAARAWKGSICEAIFCRAELTESRETDFFQYLNNEYFGSLGAPTQRVIFDGATGQVIYDD